MEDRYSNDVETAARHEQHQAIPEPPPTRDEYEDDLPDLCAHCGRELLRSEGPLCSDCWERG